MKHIGHNHNLSCSVDFDKLGKQIGSFDIPLSVHDDAWGVVRVPITLISNGNGPTVILEGGNHGDEYEGPIVLGEMIRDLNVEDVNGRLIIIPVINTPAVGAACRVSPIDGVNMNRSFPGDFQGTTTQQISAFVNHVLFPLADVFLDLHSGGSSLDIIPSSVIEPVKDPDLNRRTVNAGRAFGASTMVIIDNRGEARTAMASAAAAGLIAIGTELGGGGTVSIDALNLCRTGVRNVLTHFGVLAQDKALERPADPKRYELLQGAHVISDLQGVFEPLHPLGTKVQSGQLAGRIHFITDPRCRPKDIFYNVDGIVYGRRQPGHVKPGNCCLVVATQFDGDSND